jgi:uncharacterized protein
VLWVIHAEDRPGSGELRQATRPDHLAYVADFPIVAGGPLLGDDGEMCGSLVIIDLPDREAVDAYVAGDPYSKAGLFATVRVHGWRQVAGPSPDRPDDVPTRG